MSSRYLLLSGELPGEGVWCGATTHAGLVARVQEVWGDDFDPIFKYTLAASVHGGAEEQRYRDGRNAFSYAGGGGGSARPTAASGRGDGDEGAALCIEDRPTGNDTSDYDGSPDGPSGPAAQGLAPRGKGNCLIVIDDDADFQLWRHGRRALAMAAHTQFDPLHNAIYHPWSDDADADTAGPLTMKLFAFRKTATTSAEAAYRNILAPTLTVTDTYTAGSGRSSGMPSTTGTAVPYRGDNATDSARPYYNTMLLPRRANTTTSGGSSKVEVGVFIQRSSPAVKSAARDADDIVRPPLHTLLAPGALLRLGVRVVLRHSNAPEVILVAPSHHPGSAHAAAGVADASGCAVAAGAAGEGVAAWGELVRRARCAWGVHRPVFRYLDLTQGYTQISVTNVVDLRVWAEGVGLVNPELLVLERDCEPRLIAAAVALSITNGISSCDTATITDTTTTAVVVSRVCEDARRYRAAVAPQEVRRDEHLHRAVHLRTLAARLEALEREDATARLARPRPTYAEASGGGAPLGGSERARLAIESGGAPLITTHQPVTEVPTPPSQPQPQQQQTRLGTASSRRSSSPQPPPASGLKGWHRDDDTSISVSLAPQNTAGLPRSSSAAQRSTRSAGETTAAIAVDSAYCYNGDSKTRELQLSGAPYSDAAAHVHDGIAAGHYGPRYTVAGAVAAYRAWTYAASTTEEERAAGQLHHWEISRRIRLQSPISRV